MKTYRLTKTELKNGKFLYEVKDENNTTISKRTSTRGHYIACTIDGQFYFGRVDLIGKGMHGQLLNQAIIAKSYSVEQWEKDREAYRRELNKCIAIERSVQRQFNRDAEWLEKYIEDCKQSLERRFSIAEREEYIATKLRLGKDLYERMSNIAYLEA